MLTPKLFIFECVLTAVNLLYPCRAEKMTASLSASSATAGSTGKVFDVNVGNLKAELVFEPDTVIASVGDIINFHFYPINHSVAQSSFDKPCQPLEGGVGQIPIFSGFLPVKDGESSSMFSMAINSTDPVWLYCSQTYASHCQAGQVMVVNPLLSRFPEGNLTLEGYKAAAKNTTTSTSPKEIFGGVVIPNMGSYKTTSSSSDTSKSTPTPSAAKPAPAKGLGVASRAASMIVTSGAMLLGVGRLVL